MRPVPASENSMAVLGRIVAGEAPYHDNADPDKFGGRTHTLQQLRSSGYLDEHNSPTQAGRAKIASSSPLITLTSDQAKDDNDLKNRIEALGLSLPAGASMCLHDVAIGPLSGQRATVIVLAEEGAVPEGVDLSLAAIHKLYESMKRP